MEKLIVNKKDDIRAKFDGMFRKEEGTNSTTTKIAAGDDYYVDNNAHGCYDYDNVDYSNHLNSKNYTTCMQHLLWMEEVQMRIDIKSYDLLNAPLIRECQYLYKLHVPGLAECRTSIIKGDKIIIYVKGGGRGGMQLEGIVHRTYQEYAIMDLPKAFTNTYIDGLRVDVRFTFTQTSLRTCHQALVAMMSREDSQLRKMLFPSLNDNRPLSAVNTRIQLRLYNRSLNQEQQLAVVGIIQSVARPAPYLIYGPPGEKYFLIAIDVALSITLLSYLPLFLTPI